MSCKHFSLNGSSHTSREALKGSMTCNYAQHVICQYREWTVTEKQSELMHVWHLHCMAPQYWHAYNITYSSSGHWQIACQLLRIICPSVFCLPCPAGLSAVAAMTVLHSVEHCQFAAACTVKQQFKQTEQVSTRIVNQDCHTLFQVFVHRCTILPYRLLQASDAARYGRMALARHVQKRHHTVQHV